MAIWIVFLLGLAYSFEFELAKRGTQCFGEVM